MIEKMDVALQCTVVLKVGGMGWDGSLAGAYLIFVKFGNQKSCLCKRNDKYQVWAGVR